ncbi:uncharacterized protein LOC126746290 isoform X2 [Anthonomus grandis grandis]|uniref:uncharacterized protein LOC126746290 isoform X2 n=1 Tax=Anthonomus grandis grandis TaxID=2921223 RepID=UPI002165663B|nr:uncharacterized protein LOC126746290 isoform X2 [Anthonomus grandis grandis]
MSLLTTIFCLLSISTTSKAFLKDYKSIDICSLFNSRKVYVEYGTSGDLLANYTNHGATDSTKQCSIALITCPSCVIHLKFKYLNVSRACGKSTTLVARCQCEYVQLHEPPFDDVSSEQFCGKFVQNNVTQLSYYSKTRFVTVDFAFLGDYGHGFTLEFFAKRNQIVFDGYPTVRKLNYANQTLTTPYFPGVYPSDLSAEYVIDCHSEQPCQISLIFTDFLIADSTILEFFDWNGQRLYVISGNIFRPPIIKTSGPRLILKFYANGDSNLGFKAIYSFTFADDSDDTIPNIDCGGQVNNLGGGIAMMEMVTEGIRFYDCIWIVKTPCNFLHRKTHLYVKVVNFTDFAGRTDLILRQGITSQDPVVETLKYPVSHLNTIKTQEHVTLIQEGFYITLKGLFKPQSKVIIVYTAFNYKDCFSGLDFLCQNGRCISALLNCDGFDNCGDNSDEPDECSQDPKDHREFSKVPNFLFPKTTPYADLTAATFIFLLCTFVGIIFAMALLLYRVNVRARHQRQIQDHIDTIHAILEEGVSDMEEEIIIPDEPPDYEPPPEYSDVLRCLKRMTYCGKRSNKQMKVSISNDQALAGTSRSCQTSPVRMPESPPPAYDSSNGGESSKAVESFSFDVNDNDLEGKISCFPTKMFIELGTSLRENIRKCIFTKNAMVKRASFADDSAAIKYYSDSELNLSRRDVRRIKKRSFSTNDLLGHKL